MEQPATPLPIQWRTALVAAVVSITASLITGFLNVQITDNSQTAQTYGGTLTTLLICAGLWVSFKGRKHPTPWPIFLCFVAPGPLSLAMPLPLQTRIVYHLVGLVGIAMILYVQTNRQSPRP